jgi:hypothetical protein
VRENWQTAGPSTPLRSGRDDKGGEGAIIWKVLSPEQCDANLVIPTGEVMGLKAHHLL